MMRIVFFIIFLFGAFTFSVNAQEGAVRKSDLPQGWEEEPVIPEGYVPLEEAGKDPRPIPSPVVSPPTPAGTVESEIPEPPRPAATPPPPKTIPTSTWKSDLPEGWEEPKAVPQGYVPLEEAHSGEPASPSAISTPEEIGTPMLDQVKEPERPQPSPKAVQKPVAKEKQKKKRDKRPPKTHEEKKTDNFSDQPKRWSF